MHLLQHHDGHDDDDRLPATSSSDEECMVGSKRSGKPSSSHHLNDEDSWLSDDEVPQPGFVSRNTKWYATINNDTPEGVAAKFGCHWKDIVQQKHNQRLFGGLLFKKTRWKPKTIVRLPIEHCTMRQLYHFQDVKLIMKFQPPQCTICRGTEDSMINPMLLCDGCDAQCHLRCTHDELSDVPQDDWFCIDCTCILQSRKYHYRTIRPHEAFDISTSLSNNNKKLIIFPNFKAECKWKMWKETLHTILTHRIEQHVQDRQSWLTHGKNYSELFSESNRHMLQQFAHRLQEHATNNSTPGGRGEHSLIAPDQVPVMLGVIVPSNATELAAMSFLMNHEFAFFVPTEDLSSATTTTSSATTTPSRKASPKKTLPPRCRSTPSSSSQKELPRRLSPRNNGVSSATRQETTPTKERRPRNHEEDHKKQDDNNNHNSPTNGFLSTTSPAGVPDESPKLSSPCSGEFVADQRYCAFSSPKLFDAKLSDAASFDQDGMRMYKRILMTMIRRHDPDCILDDPSERDETSDNEEEIEKLTSEKEHGTQHEKRAVHWMLRKERRSMNMGLAGALWIRVCFLERHCSVDHYHYCDLTGTFALHIFDHSNESMWQSLCSNPEKPKDDGMVLRNVGSNGTGCIMHMATNEEKMRIVLAVMVANPPPPKRRLLRREHKWRDENHKVKHGLYAPPPCVGFPASITASAGKDNSTKQPFRLASNGTLIFVRDGAHVEQWANAIHLHAKSLQLVVLHDTDHLTHYAIASGDVVIVASLFFHDIQITNYRRTEFHKRGVPKSRRQAYQSYLQKTHWHRIIIDEYDQWKQEIDINATFSSEANNLEAKKMTAFWYTLSATHRHLVSSATIPPPSFPSSAPLQSSLLRHDSIVDWHWQYAFLRVPEWNHYEFWNHTFLQYTTPPLVSSEEDDITNDIRSTKQQQLVQYRQEEIHRILTHFFHHTTHRVTSDQEKSKNGSTLLP